MKNLTSIYCLIFTIILISCCNSTNNKKESILKVSLSDSSDNILKDSSFFSYQKTIVFETNDSSLLYGRPDRIIKCDNKYIIFDKRGNKVVVFDENGKYISSIYSVGQGPTEYMRLMDIAVDENKKQISLLTEPSAILYYSLDGSFINKKTLDHVCNEITIDDKYIYLSLQPINNTALEYNLLTINKVDGSKKFQLKAMKEIAPYCSTGKQHLYSGKNGITFSRKFDNTIYILKDGLCQELYDIDLGDQNFPENFKNKEYDCSELTKLCMENKYVYEIQSVYNTSSFLFFRTFFAGFYMLNKKNNTLNKYDSFNSKEYDIPISEYIPVENSDNEIAFIYPAFALLTYKNNTNNKMLQDLVDKINSESNPVLFIYKIE